MPAPGSTRSGPRRRAPWPRNPACRRAAPTDRAQKCPPGSQGPEPAQAGSPCVPNGSCAGAARWTKQESAAAGAQPRTRANTRDRSRTRGKPRRAPGEEKQAASPSTTGTSPMPASGMWTASKVSSWRCECCRRCAAPAPHRGDERRETVVRAERARQPRGRRLRAPMAIPMCAAFTRRGVVHAVAGHGELLRSLEGRTICSFCRAPRARIH